MPLNDSKGGGVLMEGMLDQGETQGSDRLSTKRANRAMQNRMKDFMVCVEEKD